MQGRFEVCSTDRKDKQYNGANGDIKELKAILYTQNRLKTGVWTCQHHPYIESNNIHAYL